MVADVRTLEVAGDDAGRVEQIRQLEELKRAASAAQARVTAELVVSQRAAQVAAGVPNQRAHRGVGEQVALARGESPHRGGRFVGMATALVHEMPCTMAALSDGRITEWAATCLVRETAVLQAHDRAEVDTRLETMLNEAGTSEGTLVRAAKGLAQKLDPQSAVARAAKAEADRTVTIRPAPDTMVYLTALVPVAEGVACFAALRQDAARAAATGDPRSRGQVMSDAFVARVTGRDPVSEPVPVHVDLVMTDTTLLGAGGASATVHARGQVPVPIPGPSPAPWSPAPVRPGGPGSAGSTPPRTAPPWSRWTPAPAASPTDWPTWSGCPTSPAAPRGATPRSPRPTTSRTTPTTAPPHARTPKASAAAATSPNKHRAGRRSENPTAPSPPPPRPATPTAHTHHRSSATHRRPAVPNRSSSSTT